MLGIVVRSKDDVRCRTRSGVAPKPEIKCIRDCVAQYTPRRHNDPMQKQAKQRFSPGRRVLVGIGMQPGTVKSVDDVPSVMGEFVHEVVMDGNTKAITVLGCDIHPIPALDADLQRVNPPTIHIQNSQVANVNLGSQIGSINAAIQSISAGGYAEFASAIERLTQAVLSESSLRAAEQQEIVQVLSTIATEGAKKPNERSVGIVKAAVAWLTTAISAANNLVTLWEKVGPIIKSHLDL
jgi:hypothetical protein